MTDPSIHRPSPKICLFLPSLDGGGAERVFVQLANEFAELGYSVDFALAKACGPFINELSRHIRIVDFNTSGVLRSLPRLARYLRMQKPDVMLSSLDHANVVAILGKIIARCGTRCVISMRSVPSAVYREVMTFRDWITLKLMRTTYRFADLVIANSEAVAADSSRLLKMSRRNMAVVFNPLDIGSIEALSREEPAIPWGMSDNVPMLLGVGRLDVLKDFQTLIRAFSLIRSTRTCRLAILGEGDERPTLERLIRELHLQDDVKLPGFVHNPFAWMRRAKVLVSSSLTEGCPNAVLQALACGTPVVSTDCVGGSAEILEGGRWGRLVPVGDYQAMADAIVSTLDDVCHPQVRQRANDFAQDRIVRQYLQLLLPAGQQLALEH